MDTVGDFITCIRNAGMAHHEKLDVPSSGVRQGIAEVLRERGYIRSFKVVPDGRQGVMRVYLRYDAKGRHVISKIQRLSRPGLRRYVGFDDIPKVRSGFGLAVLSTNKGILSDTQARDQKVGGELLFQVW